MATNARQHLLFHRINGHLAVLSGAIEATVGELLSVQLEAVPIRMQPPSAQTFHASLQELLAKGTPCLTACTHAHIRSKAGKCLPAQSLLLHKGRLCQKYAVEVASCPARLSRLLGQDRDMAAIALGPPCAGINKRTEERTYTTEHDEIEYAKQRPGICGLGSHGVGRPVRRTVQIPYQETFFELNRSEIQVGLADPTALLEALDVV